jgi:chemotaxis protein CheC
MKFSEFQLDALTEMINIGVGQAAGILNTMLDSHIVLRVPAVKLLSKEELEENSQTLGKSMLSAVQLGFSGPFKGNTSLVFPTESAIKLVFLLTGEDESSPDLDEIMIGALTEVGNIVLNGVMGVIGNEIKERIYYSVPVYVNSMSEILSSTKGTVVDDQIVWMQTHFTIEEHQIDGDIIILFQIGSLNQLLDALEGNVGDDILK